MVDFAFAHGRADSKYWLSWHGTCIVGDCVLSLQSWGRSPDIIDIRYS